ncbi:RNA-binding protein 45 [Silurus meridionalis]|uniref:RNA-binding protein 45 n=1 Tax=Silurus asotus TaxID=30991 RepID=A0AAD5FMD6_SILAS|nr:RNA-binding protein 45 [Silurus meridionalis]KAI5107222.1 RNA-binding protein 45 [Silurus meridionalis]KAI5621103.1 RNA-binding protein 45 [Silurus asotus]
MEEYNRPSSYLDDPPNSRLFLVTSKSITEDIIRERFCPFGEIQDIWVVKDKQTKESKGVSFVKFAKSSQACNAMEEMHGKCVAEGTKPIKVFIAQSRSSGSHRDVEDEELTRIFVMIPKTFTEDDLKETFKTYGDIEYAIIIKNKSTGESKGLGYVRYHKPSQAAKAIENCDKTFRAILAEPRTKNASVDNDYFSNQRSDHAGNEPGLSVYPFGAESSSYTAGEGWNSEMITRCLMVSSRMPVVQEQIYSLFDLIPGMEYCEMQRDQYGFSKGQAMIRYSNLGSAVYAREKLNGFEYPPGNRLSVTFIDDGEDRTSPVGKMAMQLVAAQMMSMVWNGPSGAQLMKTSAGYATPSMPQKPRVQTDVVLPSHKKLASSDSVVKERLFVIFNPTPLPVDILEDVFCRFGSLVEVYLVPGRNVGYIKYADRKHANDAMAALHGKVVNGVKMKVMLADPPKEESHKRQRTY